MTEPLNLTDEQQRALVAFARWVILELCLDYDSLGALELKADELGLLSEADKSMGIDVAHWLRADGEK